MPSVCLSGDGVGELPVADRCHGRAQFRIVKDEMHGLLYVPERDVLERYSPCERLCRIERGRYGKCYHLNNERYLPYGTRGISYLYLYGVASRCKVGRAVERVVSLLYVQGLYERSAYVVLSRSVSCGRAVVRIYGREVVSYHGCVAENNL